MEKPSEYLKVFLAYSREDRAVLNKIKTRLKILQRAQLIDQIWFDEFIEAGTDWEESIKEELASSDIILLLISDSFLASDYCFEKEMQKALEYHAKGEKTVIPIIIRHCSWKIFEPISSLQVVPSNAQPLIDSKWDTEDLPFLKMTEELITVLGKIKEKKRKNIKRFYFEERILKAETLFENSDWKLAIEEYEEALTFFERGFSHTKTKINKKIKKCTEEIQFSALVKQGEKFYSEDKFELAKEQLEIALEIKKEKATAKLLDKVVSELHEQFLLQKEEEFMHLVKQAEFFFEKREWKNAKKNYDLAYEIYDQGFKYSIEDFNQKRILVHKEICSARIQEVEKSFEIVEIKDEEDVKKIYVTRWGFDTVKMINDKLVLVSIDEKNALLTNGTELLTDFKYKNIFDVEGQYAVVVNAESLHGIIDLQTGLELVIPKYDIISAAFEGFRIAKLNGRTGFLNEEGQVLIPFQYEDAKRFGEGYAAVKKDDKWGFIDTKGNLVIDYEFDDVIERRASIFSRLNKILGGYDSKGKLVGRFDGCFTDSLVAVKKGLREFYIDKKGKKVSKE